MTQPIDLIKFFDTFAAKLSNGAEAEFVMYRDPHGLVMRLCARWPVKPCGVAFAESVREQQLMESQDLGYLAYRLAVSANAAFERKFPTVREVVPPGYSDRLE